VFPHLIIAPMPTRLSTYGADRGITRGSTSAVVGGWMQHPPHVFTVCSLCASTNKHAASCTPHGACTTNTQQG
jgi:hypothetical protein